MTIFSQKDKPAITWNKLRHLGLIKVKNSSRKLTHSVEELNAFFADVGLQQVNEATKALDVLDSTGEEFDDKKFFFKYVTPEIIRKSLARIRSCAIGTDRISSRLIRMALPHIMPVIEHMFNFSLMNGIVPTTWKTATITPIPKINHPTLVQHYILYTYLYLTISF